MTVSEEGPRALRRVLRRLQILAVAWGVGCALVYGLARGATALVVLTVAVALSIFLLRSLGTQVMGLDPREPRPGARLVLIATTRTVAVAVLLLALLMIEPGHPLAVALGAATLPFALIGEALYEAGLQARQRG